MSDLLEKIPPQALDAEQAAIGAMLLERTAIDAALEILQPGDFYRDAHRLIYDGILALYRDNEPVDIITLGNWLQAHEHLEAIGGTLYLTTLMTQVPTAAGIRHYAGIVRDMAIRREVIRQADEIMQDAYDIGRVETDALTSSAEARFLSLSDRTTADRFAGLQRLDQVVVNGVERRRQADATGYDIGYKPTLYGLRRLLPLGPGSLWVIGGEPSVGKSVLAFQVALEMAGQGARGLLVSLEMDQDMIARRMVQSATGMNMYEAEQVTYRSEHPSTVYGSWEQTAAWLRDAGVMLWDTPQATPTDLLTAGRRAKRQLGGLDFLVVDYLQLMSSDDPKSNGDDTKRVTAVSRALKPIAKHLKCGLIVVSSLNRPAQGENRKPTLHRLRQTGQIEYDVDAALLLDRPDPDCRERVRCQLAKQRNGPTGECEFWFDTTHLWFGQPEQAEESETAYQSWGGKG